MELKLVVVRTTDLKILADFYAVLGLQFEYHQHGKGPLHYSAAIGSSVFEIYPLAKGQLEADKELRLGFSLDDFDASISTLKQRQTVFLAEPMQTDYGFMAVVKDPDGRKIELYRNTVE